MKYNSCPFAIHWKLVLELQNYSYVLICYSLTSCLLFIVLTSWNCQLFIVLTSWNCQLFMAWPPPKRLRNTVWILCNCLLHCSRSSYWSTLPFGRLPMTQRFFICTWEMKKRFLRSQYWADSPVETLSVSDSWITLMATKSAFSTTIFHFIVQRTLLCGDGDLSGESDIVLINYF